MVAVRAALIDISLIVEEILVPNAEAARWKRFGVWLVLATSIFGDSTLVCQSVQDNCRGKEPRKTVTDRSKRVAWKWDWWFEENDTAP